MPSRDDAMDRGAGELGAQRRALLAGLGGVAAGAMLTRSAHAGPLNPPGAPSSTPGPEPRIPVNDANTPGDAQWMHRILQPGSYYLTKNLNGLPGKGGILIDTNGVTLDLMGFMVLGSPVSLNGVRLGQSRSYITLRNGRVIGWAETGVDFVDGARNALIEHIEVAENDHYGIRTMDATIVRSCLASNNGFTGIAAGEHCRIDDCIVRNNGLGGITTNLASAISTCTAADNTGNGIQTFAACSIHNCIARTNTGAGFVSTSSSHITSCYASVNGQHGFWIDSDSLISDCLSDSNGTTLPGAGIYSGSSGSDSRIERNHCTDNTWGIRITGGGNLIAGNTCSGNGTLNWDIAAGNKCVVVLAVNCPAFTGDSGGLSPGATSVWVNFTI